MTVTDHRPRATASEEAAYLDAYDTSRFAPFAVTTDAVVLTIRSGDLCVLLVERGEHPYRGSWALPGGFVGAEENLDDAVVRELAEETGVRTGRVHLEQLGSYGDARRDPRMRVVSVAYLALVPTLISPTAGTDATRARWEPVNTVQRSELAFDHARILDDGIERARAKLEYSPIAASFLPEEFTLSELQHVYETVWGASLHRPNFRRKVLGTPGFVVDTDQSSSGIVGRPAKLYRRGTATMLHPAILRG